MAKKGNDGCASVGGGFIGLMVLIALVPKPVWIALGVIAGTVLLSWIIYKVMAAWEDRREAREKQERARRKAQAAAARQQREEQARRARKELLDGLGATNAARVDAAKAAVTKVVASEAARAGWLGDVDFSADIEGIIDSFRKVHALRKVAGELAALENPGDDDRRILGEARATVTELERTAIERVQLIERCATEASLIDESLQTERDDARTAEQRAQLHATLSSMLYGIEAAPATPPVGSAADAVMARVQAYREIKSRIRW